MTRTAAKVTVAEVERLGVELGVHATVSDHISRDAPTTLMSLEAFALYLTDLERHDGLFLQH